MREFDAMTVPLCGRNIVEAGAGTGKTYSIQTLVARLVVEKGVPGERICIVTFTREATAELLRRLREILEDVAALCNRTEMTPLQSNEEKRAFEIIDQAMKAGVDKGVITARVNQAVTDFDTMRISTIHGFCFRILSEFAVESRVRMALVLKENNRDMLKKCFEDFCRRELYAVRTSVEMSFMWRLFGFTPDSLFELLEKLCVSDVKPFYTRYHEPEISESIEFAAVRIYEKLLACVKYCHNSKEVPAAIRPVYNNITKMMAFDPEVKPGDFISAVDKVVSKRKIVPEEVMDLYRELENFHASVLAGACDFVRREYYGRAAAEGIVDNNLVLSLLRDRITAAGYGEDLAIALAERFDAIFVDEFQDTDPIQLDIFTAICNKFSPEQVSFFIGDPKQAIYAFRGGDINCYLKGLRDIPEENRYTLSVNRRSGKKFIEEINRFYRSLHTPFAVPEITYTEAGYAYENDRIFFDDDRGEIPAFSFFVKDHCQIAMEIASLLADEKCRIFIEREGLDEPRSLRPSDFAVLVRNNRDCAPVAERLHMLGIPATVYNAENALAAEEAEDFIAFLRAILQPTDISLWKRVLCGIYFRKTAAEIAEYTGNDTVGDIEQNIKLNTLWSEHSLEAMFQAADNYYHISRNLFLQHDGRRLWVLTRKWLDLAARLEEKENLSPEVLIRRFVREMTPGQSSFSEDEYTIQIQDNEDAVKVLSIHKSKGLQFPVVYVYDITLETGRRASVSFHAKDTAYIDLSLGHYAENICEAEETAELLRLAYVAITRAQVMFRGGLNSARVKKTSFVNYVRKNPRLSGSYWNDDLCRTLNDSIDEHNPFEFSKLVLPALVPDGKFAPDAENLECRIWNAPPLISGWSKTSFSALTVSAYSGESVYADETADDCDAEEIQFPVSTDTLFDRIAQFPAGAATGNAWHEILAELPFNSGVDRIYHCVKDKLATYTLIGEGEAGKAEGIAEMLKELFNTPLPGEDGGFPLAEIHKTETVTELEFTVAAQVETALADICSSLPEYGMKSSSVNRHSASVITGAMDLVFRHNGRFYLADWKSNRLGLSPAAYSPEMIDMTMRNKYYILQALIYLEMLKRYLQWNREDYENNFGGIYYFFLRGCTPSVPGRGIWVHKPAWETLERMEKVLAGYEY